MSYKGVGFVIQVLSQIAWSSEFSQKIEGVFMFAKVVTYPLIIWLYRIHICILSIRIKPDIVIRE